MLSQRSLEVFREVMHNGSLIGAAQKLHISQPAVSRHIRELEIQTGLTLFLRSGNRASPTKQALGLLAEIDRAFIGLSEIEAHIPRIASGEIETIVIAAMPVAATTVVPEVISELTSDFPGMSVELQSARSSNILPKVRVGSFALGLVSLRQPTSGVRIIWRNSFPYYCLLPPGDELTEKRFILPADLAGRRLIGYADTAASSVPLDRVLSALNPPPIIRLRVHLSKSTWALVSSGCGVAIVDTFAADVHRSRGGTVRPFVTVPRFELALVAPEDGPRSPYVDRFVEVLEEISQRYLDEK